MAELVTFRKQQAMLRQGMGAGAGGGRRNHRARAPSDRWGEAGRSPRQLQQKKFRQPSCARACSKTRRSPDADGWIIRVPSRAGAGQTRGRFDRAALACVMASTLLEQTREAHEEVERLERFIASDFKTDAITQSACCRTSA